MSSVDKRAAHARLAVLSTLCDLARALCSNGTVFRADAQIFVHDAPEVAPYVIYRHASTADAAVESRMIIFCPSCEAVVDWSQARPMIVISKPAGSFVAADVKGLSATRTR